MTETVCLVMPAAMLATPAAPRAGRRKPSYDRSRAAASIAVAEARLRKIEAQGRVGAHAPGLASDAEIVARARFLVSESGGTLSTIVAVDKARAEAGLPPPASGGAAQEAAAAVDAIVARAREMMAESGGTLGVIAAVDRARAEAAAGTLATPASAFDGVTADADKLDGGIVAAMEAQLLDHARQAIAMARRKLKDGLPLDAGESAADAREALEAVEALRRGEPHLAKRLLHERAGPLKA